MHLLHSQPFQATRQHSLLSQGLLIPWEVLRNLNLHTEIPDLKIIALIHG